MQENSKICAFFFCNLESLSAESGFKNLGFQNLLQNITKGILYQVLG